MRLKILLMTCVGIALAGVTTRIVSTALDVRVAATLERQRTEIDLITRNAAGLLAFTQDYALRASPRAVRQWNATHRQLTAALQDYVDIGPLQAEEATELLETANSLQQLFVELKLTSSKSAGAAANERIEMLLDQLVNETRRISDGSFEISRNVQQRDWAADASQRDDALAFQGLMLTVTLLLAWLLLRRVLRPISSLQAVANAVESGDMTARTNYRSPDELGQLSNAFNTMTAVLRERAALLQSTNSELIASKLHADAANAAKTDFLANTSHEIRTPMNAVVGLTYLLQRTTLDADQQALLTKIGVASRSMLDVINDVLDMSKIEAGEMTLEPVVFDLLALLDEIVGMMQMQASQRGLEFSVEVAAGLPTLVHGDAARLRQILINLLSNAIKFTERGRVRLAVEALEADARSNGPISVRFTVEDSGIGIAPEERARLFTPFTQIDGSTTRRFGGTGLGLSIVKRLTELMGGVVGFSSVPGEGSEFWVKLDFALATTEALESREPVAILPSESALRGVRVLAVDDSDINLDVAKRILELQGAEITLATDGRQVCERLRATPQAFDVVLMDVQMPVQDGYQTTQRIRNELGLTALPVIALTAGVLTNERQRAAAAGMNDFISKPFDPDELVRCIRRHVQMEACLQAETAAEPRGSATEAWPEIDGIDAADARTRLGGDTLLLRSMLRRMLDEFGEMAAPLAAADAAALDVQAGRMHKLCGVAGTLGAKAICQLAGGAEAACRAGAADRAALLMVPLAAQLKVLEECAAPFLDAAVAGAEVGDADGSGGTGADPQLLIDLAELRVRLQAQDLSALASFSALAPALLRAWGAGRAAALQSTLDGLDFPATLELLAQAAEDKPKRAGQTKGRSE